MPVCTECEREVHRTQGSASCKICHGVAHLTCAKNEARYINKDFYCIHHKGEYEAAKRKQNEFSSLLEEDPPFNSTLNHTNHDETIVNVNNARTYTGPYAPPIISSTIISQPLATYVSQPSVSMSTPMLRPTSTVTYSSPINSQNNVSQHGSIPTSTLTYSSPDTDGNLAVKNTQLMNQLEPRGTCGECLRPINVMQKMANCGTCACEAHSFCLIAHRDNGRSIEFYTCISCQRGKRAAPPQDVDPLSRERASDETNGEAEIDEFDRFVLKHGPRLREYVGNGTYISPNLNELSMSLLSIQDYNRSRAEKEDREDERKLNYKLPIVSSIGANWLEFFAAFEKSAALYSDLENVDRIRKAIKCGKILDMGGESLFIMQSYKAVLERINRQIGTSDVVLQETLRKLLKLQHVAAHNPANLITHLNKILQCIDVLENMGDAGQLQDASLITHVVEIIPQHFKKKWFKIAAHKKDEKINPSLKHMAELIKEMMPSLYEENLHVTKKTNSTDKAFWTDNSRYKWAKNNTKVHTHNTSNHNNTNQVSCWYHKSDHHDSINCPYLTKLPGKTVFEMAKLVGICLRCGSTKHDNECVNARTCEICQKNHLALFCFKRIIRARYNNNNRNTTQHSTPPGTTYSSNNNLSVDRPALSQNLNNNAHRESQNADIDLSRFFNPDAVAYSQTTTRHSYPIRQVSMGVCLINQNEQTQIITSPSLLSVVNVQLPDNHYHAFLLDSGSSISLIEQEIQDRLKIKGYYHPLTLKWTGEIEKTDMGSCVIRIDVKKLNHNDLIRMYFHTFKNLQVGDQAFNETVMKEKYPYLQILKLKSYQKISGIIGTDQSWAFKQESITVSDAEHQKLSSPIGFSGPLGDYVMGNAFPIALLYSSLQADTYNRNLHRHMTIGVLNATDELTAQDMLEQEEAIILGTEYKRVYEQDKLKCDDIQALEILKNSTRQLEDGHWETGILWKSNDLTLPTAESKRIAIKHWRITERDAIKHGKFEEVQHEIQNLFDSNYAIRLDSSNLDEESKLCYYNPTFFIFKPHRTRMIWNLAKTINGKSINDNILVGPNLYNDNVVMMMRFREGKIIVKGDLMQMFHQIAVREKDQPALRFVYTNEPLGPLQYGQMRVLPFGSRCSPVCSQYVTRKIAESCEAEDKLCADIIRSSIYVDDFLRSFDSLPEAQQTCRRLREIFRKNGFTLAKLNSNDSHALDEVKKEICNNQVNNSKIISQATEEEVLGYKFNFEKDTWGVKDVTERLPVALLDGSKMPTKREVLRAIMKFYDPIGLFTYFICKQKLLYRKVCESHIAWDDIIPEACQTEWKIILRWLAKLPSIQLSRHYFNGSSYGEDLLQLWAFTDASLQMTCAVVFLRVVDSTNKHKHHQLIMSKCYIVPVNQKRTIPELELEAIDKGVQLIDIIKNSHHIQFQATIIATDSTCCYTWLTEKCENPNVYVKNRLQRVLPRREEIKIIWIPTKLQVADFGTKFSSMPELIADNEFYNPSIFFRAEGVLKFNEHAVEPPAILIALHRESSEKDYQHHLTNKRLNRKLVANEESAILQPSQTDGRAWFGNIYIEDHSRLETLIKSGQLAHKTLAKFRFYAARNMMMEKADKQHKNEMRKKFQVLTERAQIEMSSPGYKLSAIIHSLISKAQQDKLCEEYMLIQAKKSLPQSHKLYKYNPYIDKTNLMRIQTRIGENTEDQLIAIRDPIILPRDHHLTRLIILHEHEQNHHFHILTVIARVKAKYFFNGLDSVVRGVIRDHCMRCKRLNASPSAPFMGDLPPERLAMSQPCFTFSMVDVAGPIMINNYNKEMKRYILVICCLTTRAVHLEPLQDLTAQHTFMALYNAFNLRGFPQKIFSDCGTNFLGVRNMLVEFEKNQNQLLSQYAAQVRHIEWEFSPARSPHMNGAVESMVALTKNAFTRVQRDINGRHEKLTDPLFRFYLCEVTGMLNDRPICPYPLENQDNAFLTPNFFLNGRSLRNVRLDTDSLPKTTLSTHIDNIQRLSNILWRHWLQAYIPTIMHRSRWYKPVRNIEVGDLVVVMDPSFVNNWRLGIVIEASTGSRDQTRKLKIQLGQNELSKEMRNLLKTDLRNPKQRERLLESYKAESRTIVTRSAHGVAVVDIGSTHDVSLLDELN